MPRDEAYLLDMLLAAREAIVRGYSRGLGRRSRNRLVHDYAGIDLERVWGTAQRDILGLIALLEPLVPPDTD